MTNLHTIKTVFDLSDFGPGGKIEGPPPEDFECIAHFGENDYFQALRYIKKYRLRTKGRTKRVLHYWTDANGSAYIGIFSRRYKASELNQNT